jgi:hypothetical protein
VLILSLGVSLVGVFVLPVLGASLTVAKYALGWSMLLLAGYPLATAGHYEILFGHSPEQRRLLRERRRNRRQSNDQHAGAGDQIAQPPREGWRSLPRASHQEMWCVALIAAASVAYWVAVILREAP